MKIEFGFNFPSRPEDPVLAEMHDMVLSNIVYRLIVEITLRGTLRPSLQETEDKDFPNQLNWAAYDTYHKIQDNINSGTYDFIFDGKYPNQISKNSQRKVISTATIDIIRETAESYTVDDLVELRDQTSRSEQ